jgi:hypothetical protein
MDTKEQDFLGISSGKYAPTASPPLDTSAKTLADGTISRKQALKLMGAGTAAVASLALAGCGGDKDQAKDTASGSRERSGGSTSNTTVAQNGSTPKQGSAAQEAATVVMGESMTGVPATVEMHFRNGAVAISYLGTVLLQLVDEGKVALDDTIDEWLPDTLAAEKVTLRMLANCTSGYPDYVTQKSFNDGWVAPPTSALRPCVLSNYPRPTTASLRVIDCLCEDGSSLFEETIYYARPPQ